MKSVSFAAATVRKGHLLVSDELDVLKSVTAQLEGAGISYMVTGSMAANFYAVPRMTRDINLVIELSERHVDRVPRLFQQDYFADSQAKILVAIESVSHPVTNVAGIYLAGNS